MYVMQASQRDAAKKLKKNGQIHIQKIGSRYNLEI